MTGRKILFPCTAGFLVMGLFWLYPNILIEGAHAARAEAPAAAPAGALKIEQLSPAQRASMPDATKVTLKNGVVVTLGFLRALHVRRVARFAGALQLGKNFTDKASPAVGKGDRNLLNAASPQLQQVPMKPILMGAADYRSFCAGAAASGCLYFPAGAFLGSIYGYTGYFFESDPLVTDANVCSQEGGVMYGGNCVYPYPVLYQENFNPGTPPPGQPIGAGVTSKVSCNQPFAAHVDPKGAIQMEFTLTQADFTTGAIAPSCVVHVYKQP
jgi:hypothetical protein